MRDAPKIKFGRTTGPRTFARNQVWLATPSSPGALLNSRIFRAHTATNTGLTAGLKFFDETVDTIANYHDISNNHISIEPSNDPNSVGHVSEVTSPIEFPRLPTPTAQVEIRSDVPDNLSVSSMMTQSQAIYHRLSESVPPVGPYTSRARSRPSSLRDFGGSNQQQTNSTYLSKDTSPHEDRATTAFLRAILVRYYTENLAHWFDLNDPLRHFTRVVPLRSRHSRPLLNAILTASARQLVRARRHRNEAGAIQWQEHVLSDLNEELVMQIQNECIRELLELSLDPEQVMSADLLAAAVILRTDEEMDALFREDGADDQVFLGVIHAYIDAQVACVVSRVPESGNADSIQSFDHIDSTRSLPSEHNNESPEVPSFPVSYESLHHLSHEFGPYSHSLEANSSRALRQACFWAACRQDVHASMYKQKPINFPLEYCNALRSLAPAEDYVWTIRTIVFCADVLEYCYGRRSGRKEVRPAYTDHRHWRILKQRAMDIAECLPNSFEPAYFSEPNIEAGEVFPQIWFQDPCYATGTGHLELAQILLTAFDPSIPRLGLGKLVAHRDMSKRVERTVLRLCGIAISNRKTPPNFINAFVAIVSYGEYITNLQQQTAILQLMDTMQFEFAYYTARVADGLKHAWNQYSAGVDDINR